MTNEELLELAKLTQTNFHNRRSMEWRLLLGYWTGLALVTYAIISGKASVSGVPLALTLCGFFALLLVMVFFCILPVQRGHALDQAFFHYYTRTLEGIQTERPTPTTAKLNRAWLAGQVLFSTLLTAFAMTLISNARNPNPEAPNHALQRTGSAVTPAASATPPPSPAEPGSGRASSAGR